MSDTTTTEAAPEAQCICWELGATGWNQIHTLCPALATHLQERDR